jgi:uncharacterized membrane protein YebE (DUF533 family)
MKLEELSAGERRAMAGLVRLIVRVDGQLSAEERDRLHEIATDLGEDAFWEILQSNDEPIPFRECVEAVEGEQAQELIFEVIMTLAMVGTIDRGEAVLLEKLAEAWGIEVQAEAPPDESEEEEE